MHNSSSCAAMGVNSLRKPIRNHPIANPISLPSPTRDHVFPFMLESRLFMQGQLLASHCQLTRMATAMGTCGADGASVLQRRHQRRMYPWLLPYRWACCDLVAHRRLLASLSSCTQLLWSGVCFSAGMHCITRPVQQAAEVFVPLSCCSVVRCQQGIHMRQ